MTSFFIFPLTVLLTLAGLLFIGISYSRRELQSKEVEATFLLQVYFFIVLLVSSFAIFWGSSLLIKAGVAYKFGLPFSYQGEIRPEPSMIPPPSPEAPTLKSHPLTPPKPIEIRYEEHLKEKDVLQGAMFLLFGLLFFGIHKKAFRYIIGDTTHAFLKKSYYLIGTLVYGGITLVSIPIALYTLLERMLFKEVITPENLYRLQYPGELLGYAIPALIIWYLFFTHIKNSPLKTKN